MNRSTTVRLLIGAIVFSGLGLGLGTAEANKVKKLSISAPDGFKNAPVISVYSTSGEKWNKVDQTKVTKFTINLSAKCKYEGKGNKAYKGKMTVYGFALVGDSDQPADFLIPHSNDASGQYSYGAGQELNPIGVCNTELSKRLSEHPELTKYHLMAKGFVVNYPAALSVGYYLTCKPTGLGFTDTASKKTHVNAKISCQASALAKNKIPKPKPKTIPAKVLPLIKSVSFKAVPEQYKGACPTSVKFNGKISSNTSGTVKYRYVSHDGRESPAFSLTFTKAATLGTRKWSRTVSKPKPGNTLSSGGQSSAYDIKGWYRLEVLSPKPTGSVTAKYRVDCVKPTPARAIIKN